MQNFANLESISAAPNLFQNKIRLSISSIGVKNIPGPLITSECNQLRVAFQKLHTDSNVIFSNYLVKTIRLFKTAR